MTTVSWRSKPASRLTSAFGDAGGAEVQVEALGHHVVGEQVGVVTGVEHQRTRARRHLGVAANFAQAEHLLVVEGGGGERGDAGRADSWRR